jgi:hypothetical protein
LQPWYAFACSELAARERTLTVLPHSTAIGAIQQGERVGESSSRRAAATAAAMRSGKFTRTRSHTPESADDRVQQCTWMYKSRRLDPAFDWRPDSDYNRDIGHGEYLHWGCQVDCRDTTDPAALREAEQAAWAAMLSTFHTLQRHGFAVTQLGTGA